MEEAYCSAYAMYPGSTKMYKDRDSIICISVFSLSAD